MKQHLLSFVMALTMTAGIGSAAVFEKMTDRQLIERSNAVVTGTIRDVVSHRRADGMIITDYHLTVEEVLKGELPHDVTITEFGGIVGSRVMFVADGATYALGERVLAFLRQRPDGTWFTTSMALGKFTFDRNERGEAVVVRSASELDEESPRLQRAFADYVRGVARGTGAQAHYLSASPAVHLPVTPNGTAKQYALIDPSSNLGARWQNSTVTFLVNGSLSFDASNGIHNGMAAWTNDPASNINLVYGGSTTINAPDQNDHNNVILLGYSSSAPSFALCDASDACTLLAGNFTHTFDGDNWITLDDVDILVRPSVGPAQVDALMTHEFGHAIGIRHSNQGTPSSSDAVMNFPVNAAIGANLKQWDKDAVDSLYGSGPVCQPPAITTTFGGGIVAAGSSTTLSVTATGTAPLHYQWYDGTSGDLSTLVGSDSSTFTTPAINSPKNYWVQVSNSCGSANSSTITVTPQTCQKPAILVDPQSQTIALGGTATLSVGHSGTSPFSYQWYEGQSGDLSKAVLGANARDFTTPPLSQKTLYWVRVSNGCGSVDSATATISIIGGCDKPLFTLQPASGTGVVGKKTFLSATATGATSYQWYKGTPPDISTPLPGLAASPSRFVTQAYLDLLGREPDAGAIAFFSAVTPTQTATSILTSDEYRSNLVRSFYLSYLHRSPSPSDVSFWLPAMTAGLTDEQVASQFLGSGEYFALFGSNNSSWVSAVYNDILGRSAGGAETAFWVGALGSTSRANVALSILNSAEARSRRVQQYFNRFLRRNASTAESSAFLSALTAGQTNEQVIAAIVSSTEYNSAATMVITEALNASASYWVQATNSCGSTNSSAATINIAACAAPIITTQPQNVTINVGGAPSLSVSASGGSLTYQWYRGNASDLSNPIAGATAAAFTGSPLFTAGTTSFWVKVTNECASTNSTTATVTVNCAAPAAPTLSVTASTTSQLSYPVSWSGNSLLSTKYELQEATKSDFSDATTTTITDGSLLKNFIHSNITVDTRYSYRVRAFALCNGSAGSYSNAASILVTAPAPPDLTSLSQTGTPCTLGSGRSCTITGTVSGTWTKTGKTALDLPVTFNVAADKPWITLSPSSGNVPDDGTVTVTYTIDLTKLELGSTESTLTFNFLSSTGKVGVFDTQSKNVPVNVSLVAPVASQPKDNNAPPNTMLIPAVAHADGIGARFVSDVRLTNTSTQPITYLLTFTPTATDGTQNGKQATITVNGGDTKALNDVVKDWYGSGVGGEAGVGTIEIRPGNYSGKTGDVNVNFVTVASSRTYAVASNGTFGQFIPAISLVSFLAKSDASKISLQQVAQSSAYRTNVGFVEGSGQPVSFVATLLDDKGNTVATQPYSLRPFEHQQKSLTSFFGNLPTVTDGRVEVKVTSDTGRLTAYASVLDNITTDPLLVFPVDPSKVAAKRFVVPGVAEFSNSFSNFHTDMRIYNGSASATNVTLTFPANGALPPVQKQLAAGEVWAIDNVLPTLWKTTGGGAVVATTDSDAPLVVTARTFSRDATTGGTFGQFIPGVTSIDAVGLGERALQVPQLEQSPAFRSNLGLVEVTGNPVTLDVSGFMPDSKIAAHTQVTLAPGQFLQQGNIFAAMGITSNVYNGRVSVKVISGTGRVAAYGSVIDNRTQDPTYVPAQ